MPVSPAGNPCRAFSGSARAAVELPVQPEAERFALAFLVDTTRLFSRLIPGEWCPVLRYPESGNTLCNSATILRVP
jgi:hypothetical protein